MEQPLCSVSAEELPPCSHAQADIMNYRCTSDMNVTHWLNDMQRLFNTLCSTDPESMSDRSFALAILDNMPQDDRSWCGFLSALCGRVHDYDSQDLLTPIVATEFIAAIRDEFWFCYGSARPSGVQGFSEAKSTRVLHQV